jgi:endonuclease/exonuclease/phosphatase family metal-dependent hydrolase
MAPLTQAVRFWEIHCGTETIRCAPPAAYDTYSGIDYILVSHGMEREWLSVETYVLSSPNWGMASDHRPLVASFAAEAK